MKTAISIPDSLFEAADRLARRMNTSRSRLFSLAVADYIARHDADAITEAMDHVCDQLDAEDESEPLVSSTARRTLRNTQW